MNRAEIIELCMEYSIFNYTIKEDGLGLYIDVDGDINLSFIHLHYIPIRFGYVSGNFTCRINSLNSLKHCPTEVGGNFVCDWNQITSLEGGPVKVGGDFNCSCNSLTSLEHCPTELGGKFRCYANGVTIASKHYDILFDLGYDIDLIYTTDSVDIKGFHRTYMINSLING
jgi:hypothetical protein